MKPLAYPLLTDENIHPGVVNVLRALGKDVLTAAEAHLAGKSDEAVLDRAVQEGRVVLTHDSDFGRLVSLSGLTVPGIVYLRPGHLNAALIAAALQSIEASVGDVEPGFILVAEYREERVRIRLRAST